MTFTYCQMIQTARLHGDSFLAHADYHECKLGASNLGLVNCPEDISSGSLYFDKLMKYESRETGASIYESLLQVNLQHIRGSVVLRGCHHHSHLKGELNVSLGCDGSSWFPALMMTASLWEYLWNDGGYLHRSQGSL